jgi:F0F1-type ATP synthase membrane subunit b/b'
MFTIVPILVVAIFIFTFTMIFSPKARGKMLSNQIKSLNSMLENSKDDIASLSKTATNLQKEILEQNEENLKDIATTKANINKDAIEITAEAIKKGLNK